MSRLVLRSRLLVLTLAFGCLASTSVAGPVPHARPAVVRSAYKPSPAELKAAYTRADGIRKAYEGAAFMLRVQPNWIENGHRFWYRNDLKDGKKAFVLVDPDKATRGPAFDHAKLAAALSSVLSKKVDADRLPFQRIGFAQGGKAVQFRVDGDGFECDLSTYALKKAEVNLGADPGQAPGRRGQRPPEDRPRSFGSPDGAWSARIVDHNILVKPKEGDEFKLTTDGSDKAGYEAVTWTPDSKRLILTRVTAGDRSPVYLIESSPKDGGRAKLHTRSYDLPGDKVDTYDLSIWDPVAKASKKVDAEPVDWWEMPRPRFEQDKKHFTYEKLDRGYGRWRVIEVDSETGSTRTLIDDKAKTFIDITSQYIGYCQDTDEMIWRSEKDGWAHLYLVDGVTGTVKNPITKGEWVVRSVLRIDEKARQIIFAASGMNPNEDPYFLQYYRVNFDGSALTPLTEGNGSHSVQFSPDNQFLIDTWSRVDMAPVHVVRRASDGKQVCKLEEADISELKKLGWRAPEVFVAKGRDAKTDIWGIVYKPMKFDLNKSYPMVEDIYAGPQDSFVPKTFAPYRANQGLAELGFMVVKIDGMGTRNRSKAFHDVCFKNLGDAGLPDRILWMKALAKKYPYMDVDRVGVYGTSAGGQNSTGAVLFHPEFYKAAVSSCGCHDNRMDKVWWNEQWMSYPVGPQYGEQSNITNAPKLKGHLLLMVGEMDTNVPPESTLRLCDALIKAKKNFDFLMIPGSDHTDGGPYGEHKRRDFFVHWLLGVEPPDWNGGN